MLKKIEQLVIRDIRCWDGERTIDFDDGITLIHGENGGGKTTLNTILMLTLVYSANSNGIKADLTPTNGGSPRSSVTFSTEDGRYTISKTWGSRDQSRIFDADTNEELERGGAAEDLARKLAWNLPSVSGRYTNIDGPIGNLEKSIEAALPALAFHIQGHLHIALKMGEQVVNLGLEVDDADRAKAYRQLSNQAKSEEVLLISSTTAAGIPRATARGEIIDKNAHIAQIENDIQEAEEVAELLLEAERKLFESSELGEDEINEESREETRQTIRELLHQCAEHRDARENARLHHETLKEGHGPLKTLSDERNTLLKADASATKGHTQQVQTEAKARLAFEKADADFNTARQAHEGHSTEREYVKQWQLFNSQEQRNREQELLLEQNILHRQKHQDGGVNQTNLRNQLGNLTLATEEQWGQIKDYDAKIAAAKASRKMTVNVQKLPKGWVVLGDGQVIEKAGDAAELIEVRKNDSVLIDVRQAMDGLSPSELELQKQDFLHQIGAESTSDLNKRQAESVALNTEIAAIQRELNMLPPIENIEVAIAELQAKIERRVEMPDGTMPNVDLHDELVRLEERVRLASDALDKAREDRATTLEKNTASQTLRQTTEETSLATSATLEEHRTTHGNDESLEESEASALARMNEALALFKAFVEAKPIKEDAPEKRAELLQRDLDTYDNQRDTLIRLEEEVKRHRENHLLQILPDLQTQYRVERTELESLQLDYKAFQLIGEFSEVAGNAAQEQARTATSERLNRLLNYVWGVEPEITLGEDGAPVTTRQIPINAESHGTREQLQTVLRLVLLSTAAPNGTTILLDDALVFASDGRLSRMKDVLSAESRAGMQMIIFSCKQGDYVDIADHIINLDD